MRYAKYLVLHYSKHLNCCIIIAVYCQNIMRVDLKNKVRNVHVYLIFSTALKSSQASDETYHQQQSFNFTYLEVTSPGSLVHTAE